MRRLLFNLFVSILTFAVGLAASALQNVFTSYGKNTDGFSNVVLLEPAKPAPGPTITACRCSDETGGYPVEPGSFKAPISGGILNGKAIILPHPPYPPVAKAAHQSGKVIVQVLIDERGCVLSARAVSGPPLLQAAAVQAAWKACFSPTRLSGQPVKVTGVVTYNFVLP